MENKVDCSRIGPMQRNVGVGYFITGTDNIAVTFARETVCCCASHVAG